MNIKLCVLGLALAGLSGCDDGSEREAAPSAGDATVVDGAVADATDEVVTDAEPMGMCAIEPPQLDSIRLTAEGPVLRDALGRQVLLRGVNTGGRSKSPPYFPFPFAESGRPEQAMAPAFDEAAAIYTDRLVDWGLNVARVPFSWEALEPEPGQFDQAFLDRYVGLLEALHARGVRTIVDFHQDVWARPFCGDGFPLWTIEGEVPDIPPAAECHSWFTGYLAPGPVRDQFDRFWAGEDGLPEAFEAMWSQMVQATGDLNGVIGYEIINEPGWGNATPAEWGPDVLAPFYEHMSARIQAEAPWALVFFDGTGGEALLGQTDLARPEGDGLVFAPHSYQPSVILEGRWDGQGDIAGTMAGWANYQHQWSLPVILGEFGIPPNAENAAGYVREHFDGLDAGLIHGTLWEYSATLDDWNEEGMSIVSGEGVEQPTVEALIRPYPAAVAGDIESFSIDHATWTATLTFTPQAGISEIIIPVRWAPDGVTADLEGPGCVRHDQDAERLWIETAAGDEAVTLTLRRLDPP